ncbi:MAG: NPCBM/NEW2 domain-containing protein [Phycisphaerae bacterium]|nr:NPCBM/NEW2 domain-containing protein [Phycisphaerae bacterium]
MIAGRVVSGDGRRLSVQSPTLGRVELGWEDVARIDCAGDRLTFLSDLRPTRYEFTPLFHKRWAFASDRSLLGGPLRLGGRTYSRGVAMRSRAVLTYSVAGEFRQFAAAVGISDEMEQRGRADVAVIGDGRTLWDARDLRGGQPPREVLIDVSGVQELTLVVDYGGDLDLADHVIWALARLIR